MPLGMRFKVDPSSILSDESELISGCAWAVASSGPPWQYMGELLLLILQNTLSMPIPPLGFFVYEFRTVLFIVRRVVTAPNPNFHENKPLQGTTIILIFYILS